MHGIELITGVVFFGVVIFIGYRISRLMSKATGTPWQKFMSVFKYSGTILWSRILLAFGVVTGILSSAGDYLTNVPAIQSAVHDLFPSNAAPWYVAGIAVVTEYLRRRPVPANIPPVSVPLAPLAVAPSAPTSPTVVTAAVVAPPTATAATPVLK